MAGEAETWPVRRPVPRIFTIGHSTHSFDEFVSLLEKNSVETVADIRTVPRSRKFPHFGTERLASTLPGVGIAYHHLVRLGGWRKPEPDSVNPGWRHKSFRGYADYTLTPEFRQGLEELVALADRGPTAMMCSEALWWRCHRRLVSDQIVGRGGEVLHIGSDGRTSIHEMTEFAVIAEDGTITYPG